QVLGVAVRQSLSSRNVADRGQCRCANLAHTLSNNISGGENVVRLLIEQQMKIAKVWARHVPMEVLRLHVQGKHVGKKRVQSGRNPPGRFWAQVSRRLVLYPPLAYRRSIYRQPLFAFSNHRIPTLMI